MTVENLHFVLMEKLEAKGAVVEYNDLYVPVVPPLVSTLNLLVKNLSK